MTIDKIGSIIKKIRMVEGLSQEQLAKKLGVSSMSIHSYEHKKRTPSMKLYPKLIELYPNFKDQILEISTDKDESGVTKGEIQMPEQYSLQHLITSNENNQELIKLQKEKIKSLEDKAKEHDSVYDGIQSDIVFTFDIKFNWSLTKPGVKVKYYSQDSDYVPVMAQKLGYTELEMTRLLQIDEMVEYKDHNIHQLRSKKQKTEMLNIMDNFIKAYNSIKLNTTMLVAEIPVLYTHKNGTIYKSNVEYRINWVRGTGTAHIRWLKD